MPVRIGTIAPPKNKIIQMSIPITQKLSRNGTNKAAALENNPDTKTI